MEALAAVYRAHGFRDYMTLVRMVRMGAPALDGDDAEVATADDVPAIGSFLDGILDRYYDQIPEPGEVLDAVQAGNLLVVRRGGEVGGVLWSETTGLTTHLRYWYVHPQFVNQGIGARLIRTYFRRAAACRRFILWVIANNADSIARYEHYGFRRENLVDRIMMKAGDSPT